MLHQLSFSSPRKLVPEMLVETSNLPRFDDDPLSVAMWKAALSVAEQALKTVHIQGIKYGDLDPNGYGRYTVQDAIYCYHSTEQYKILAERATDQQIKSFANKQYQGYEEYTKELFEKWCISDPNAIKLSPVLQEYVNYKYEILNTQADLYFIVANIPCLRLWAWLASQLTGRLVGPANLYSFWVEGNLDDSSARELENFVDSKASTIELAKAIDIYKMCMKGELGFFSLSGSVRSYLQEGDFLLPGDRIFSEDEACQLIYQDDGNLVVYESSTKKPLWASNTQGSKAWRTYMQDDGNFVIYQDYSKPVWSSGLCGAQYKGSILSVKKDGNLVICESDGKVIWQSKK